MDLKNSLTKLGLKDTESRIYLTLLRYKDMTTVKLAKEIGIHRRTIYDNLDLLTQKGFVTYKEIKGVKYFNANNVSVLKSFIEEKENTLNQILPTLIELQKDDSDKAKIEILLGIQGVKSILTEAVDTSKELYWIGGGLNLIEKFKFSKYMQDKFSKLKIRLLQPETDEAKKRALLVKNKEIRYLPKDHISTVGYIIFSNTLVIGQLKKDEIISIVIRSKDFSDTFRQYFHLMWKSAKK